LVRFWYTVPSLPMKSILFFLFYLLDVVASQTPSLPSQPAWPKRRWLGQARFGYTTQNFLMNWTDLGVWYHIYLWTDQIRVYSTKFTNESDVFVFLFLFLEFCGQPDTQPPSQPAWPQRSRLVQARFGYIRTHLFINMNWTDSGMRYKIYLWIGQILVYDTKSTKESDFNLSFLFIRCCGLAIA